MQEKMLEKTMHMTVHWGWNISFVFEQFTVLEDEVGLLILWMAISFIISLLSVLLPSVKTKVMNQLFRGQKKDSLLVTQDQGDENDEQQKFRSQGEVLFNFCYIFFYSLMHILTMMLIMTYNGYVIIDVIFGLTIGYTIFGFEVDKDKNIPVNCCA